MPWTDWVEIAISSHHQRSFLQVTLRRFDVVMWEHLRRPRPYLFYRLTEHFTLASFPDTSSNLVPTLTSAIFLHKTFQPGLSPSAVNQEIAQPISSSYHPYLFWRPHPEFGKLEQIIDSQASKKKSFSSYFCYKCKAFLYVYL